MQSEPAATMRSCVLVHYDEIALKGRNRPSFVARLGRNLAQATRGLGGVQVRRVPGRLVLGWTDLADDGGLGDGMASLQGMWDEICARLQTVFGVAYFAPALMVRPALAELEAATTALVAGRQFGTFAVAARRGNKGFPLTSVEVNRHLGTMVQRLTGAAVDLESPALTVHVEISFRDAFVYVDRGDGAGGLPVGMGGRVVALLSGGFDSPVAAYRALKRGSRVTFVHFHSHPFLSAASREKARELTQLLTRHQYGSDLYLVPFGELQREVVLGAPEPPRVIIYRRLMVRIARAVAERVGARALVTGESLGQVASQTLENMAVIDAAAGMLVLRPLVSWDKREILAEARRIGTYPISAVPDQDCCTLFVPRHPATYSTVEAVEQDESRLDVDALVAAALARAEVEHFTWPAGERPLAMPGSEQRELVPEPDARTPEHLNARTPERLDT